MISVWSKSKSCFIDFEGFAILGVLALGSWPRQRLARLRAKREARESHHMLLRMQRVQRIWRNEPSHSQMNSHYGSWSPKWTPKSSKRNCKGQNPLVRKVHFIIGKLLKHKYLKWACMTHLDIWNTSYGQKKGWKSNWQFDSWPLKVRNMHYVFYYKSRWINQWVNLYVQNV